MGASCRAAAWRRPCRLGAEAVSSLRAYTITADCEKTSGRVVETWKHDASAIELLNLNARENSDSQEYSRKVGLGSGLWTFVRRAALARRRADRRKHGGSNRDPGTQVTGRPDHLQTARMVGNGMEQLS